MKSKKQFVSGILTISLTLLWCSSICSEILYNILGYRFCTKYQFLEHFFHLKKHLNYLLYLDAKSKIDSWKSSKKSPMAKDMFCTKIKWLYHAKFNIFKEKPWAKQESLKEKFTFLHTRRTILDLFLIFCSQTFAWMSICQVLAVVTKKLNPWHNFLKNFNFLEGNSPPSIFSRVNLTEWILKNKFYPKENVFLNLKRLCCDRLKKLNAAEES